ncbi:NTP transferase domain-containing protein [Agromyces sp. NPDC056523]|uniref:NTP transferase domain-containing protein n=1 Tax=Agromyces sp. NPDC056523 TaxID=3345850 RepID=UPI00367179E1
MSWLDAVILAGGRAERLGGASKPDLVVGGRRLLETAIAAARSAGCERIVVVGPPQLQAHGCLVVREEPPFGGPVAGLAAGLAALAAPDHRGDVLVLASDLPHAEAAVARLLAARTADPGTDGVCLVDSSGRSQWLTAVYSRAALSRAFDALAVPDSDPARLHGAAMRRLAASVDLTLVAGEGTTRDIDTWSDLAEARARTGGITMAEPQHPEVLDEWVAEAAPLVGIDPADVPIGTLLELARRAAHGVARPAAPVTTFLLGLAVGSGRSTEDLDALADRLGALAEQRGSGGGGAAM